MCSEHLQRQFCDLGLVWCDPLASLKTDPVAMNNIQNGKEREREIILMPSHLCRNLIRRIGKVDHGSKQWSALYLEGMRLELL